MQYKVFGCKVNKYYTDKWLNSEYLRDKTGTFVASCVVTDSAKRKWVRFVKKEVENITGNGKIFISGCGAFKDGKAQENFFEIYPDLSFAKDSIEVLDEAPKEDSEIPSLREDEKHEMHNDFIKSEKKFQKNNSKIDLSKLKAAQKTQIYTRKYLLIQGGCDSFCTFCLTVQKRGKHYYRAAEDIVEEIKDFENEGGKEVVLTGVNLSAWGLKNTHSIESFSQDITKNGVSGKGSHFSRLLTYILENTEIPRIRISSLGPEFIDKNCLEIFENERIYPHFHFSIQSGSSNTLKSMARHYDGEYIKNLLLKLRSIQRSDEVDISIGADIIVGFPGESESDFMDTYNLIQDCNITKVHAFPFSAHTMGESVPAGKFPNQVDEKIKKDRMQRLMLLSETIRETFKESQKGKTLRVLVEKSNLSQFSPTGEIKLQWSGWSENYIEIDQDNFEIVSGIPKRNTIVVGTYK